MCVVFTKFHSRHTRGRVPQCIRHGRAASLAYAYVDGDEENGGKSLTHVALISNVLPCGPLCRHHASTYRTLFCRRKRIGKPHTIYSIPDSLAQFSQRQFAPFTKPIEHPTTQSTNCISHFIRSTCEQRCIHIRRAATALQSKYIFFSLSSQCLLALRVCVCVLVFQCLSMLGK